MAEIKPITGSEIQKIFVKVPTKESLGFAAGTVNGFTGEWPAASYSSAYNSVIFIEDTHDIWAQGKFYGGLSAEQEADLTYILAGLGSEIKTTKDLVNSIIGIHGTEGPEIGTSRIGVIDAIDVTPTAHTGDGFSYYTYDFTYSYSYVEAYNNPEATDATPETLSVIPIATSISINRDASSGNAVISLSYTYSEINAANISAAPIQGDGTEDAYQITGSTIQAQLEQLVSQINDIHDAQEGGFPRINIPTGYVISYLHATGGVLNYGTEKLDAANITYIAASGEGAEATPEVTVAAALEQLASKLDNARDNYLAGVSRVTISKAAVDALTDGKSNTKITTTGEDNALYIEFEIKSRTAKTDDDSTETPTVTQYIYVAAQDLLNNYTGTTSAYTATGINAETQVVITGTEIKTQINALDIAATGVSTTALTGYADIPAGNVQTSIQALDTYLGTVYNDLSSQIDALDGATVKTVDGGNNISVSANDGTYTVSAYFTYDFSTDTTGYVKTGAAQTYTDIVGYLNAGIADAHTDAIDTATNNAYASIATYMMWHTVGETTNP